MLTACPKCQFIFEYSPERPVCPRCNSPAEAPEDRIEPPEERPAAVPEQAPGPPGGFSGYKLVRKEPEVPEGAGPAGITDTADTVLESAPEEDLPMAPLKRRAFAQWYDNLELTLYLAAGAVLVVAFVRLKFYFVEPSSLSEVNRTIDWAGGVLIVFFAAAIYYFQIHIPYQNRRTRGQQKYGLFLEKEGTYTYGMFVARALGQCMGLTVWTYFLVQLFRRNSPDNDEIRGLEDIFSGTRQVVADRIEGKPVERLMLIVLIIGALILSIFLVAGLMQSSVGKYRQEQSAKREVFKQRLAALKGFENIEVYVEKVEAAKLSCSDGACVSSYKEYKTAYLDPIKEMGRSTDNIFLHYAKSGKGSLAVDRIRDEAARKTVQLMFFNGICYRKELMNDKLITEDTLDAFGPALMRSRTMPKKDLDSKCPVRDPSLLQ